MFLEFLNMFSWFCVTEGDGGLKLIPVSITLFVNETGGLCKANNVKWGERKVEKKPSLTLILGKHKVLNYFKISGTAKKKINI